MPMTLKKTRTREERLLLKIENDPQFYIENFLKIRDKRSNLIPFKLNHAQQIVLRKVQECEKEKKLKRFIVLKARQMGLSTLFEGIIFHDTSTKKFKNSMIIAHEEPASQNLFNMSKLFYEYLPDVIRPMKKYSNGKILSFENPETNDSDRMKAPGLKSKITIATAGAGEVGRSATMHNLHASEVAFFPEARKTMVGLLQSIPDEMNTFVALESTANGVGDWFHDMWQKSVKGENEFVPIFLPWFIDPSYKRIFRSEEEKNQLIAQVEATHKDNNGKVIQTYEKQIMIKHDLTYEQLNWRRYTMANKCQGDEELFMQEYPSTPEEAFISTGRPRFTMKSLKQYQTITKDPIMRGYLREGVRGEVDFIEDDHGYVSIWKKPDDSVAYCLGGDVAEGLVDGDYSAGIMMDSQLDVVALWHGHIDPDLFGKELVKFAKYYNNAYLGVENNNHGLTTLNTIKREEYYNLYFSKSYDKIADTMTQKLGWSTNIRTKPLMIDKLGEFIREHHIGIYSDLLISECFTYIIEDSGKTNAQPGCYDDTVMATAIALQLILEGMGEDYVPEVPIEERGDSYRRDIVDPMFEEENEYEFAD